MVATALTFFIILSVLVLVHELGHYIVAKMIGVRIDEFGFGFPPRILGRKIRGTVYSFNWLPIGGFVKLAGEDEENEKDVMRGGVRIKDKKQYFWARTRKERAAILLAGVAMNFLLAVVVTTVLLTHGIIEPTDTVHIEKILSDSPAEMAGLKEKDIIRSITYTDQTGQTHKEIHKPSDLIDAVKISGGNSVTLAIIRNGESFSVEIVPRTAPPKGEGPLGVAITNLERRTYPLSQAPFHALKISIFRVWQMITSIFGLLLRLMTGSHINPGEVSGPVGIAKVTGEAVKYGWEAVLEFASILSLNLAVLNILPFPALDGGRLAFVVAEKLGKKARPAVERTIHQIGMILLLALLLLITISDIINLAGG